MRVGERQLRRDDRTALQLVALPLSLLARESALLTEVRTARAALADVREREQLTLHRDLHDGLGPLLTGAVMRADAARNLLATDVEAARDSLDAARSDLRVAVTELRRVVYRLWPLELEQRGLWGPSPPGPHARGRTWCAQTRPWACLRRSSWRCTGSSARH